MMLFVDVHTDQYASRVRLAHTETATESEIIERATLHNGIGWYLDAHVLRALDMDGDKDIEVSTVTFWRD